MPAQRFWAAAAALRRSLFAPWQTPNAPFRDSLLQPCFEPTYNSPDLGVILLLRGIIIYKQKKTAPEAFSFSGAAGS
jgi:hypothetical protein